MKTWLMLAALGLPLPTGAVNPAVTQANLAQTVCARGWTRSERPSEHWIERLKVRQMRAWHYDDQDPHDFTEDHVIPLELGGAPRDPRNLMPQPTLEAVQKDQVEDFLHMKLCTRQLTLKQVQTQILQWRAFYGG